MEPEVNSAKTRNESQEAVPAPHKPIQRASATGTSAIDPRILDDPSVAEWLRTIETSARDSLVLRIGDHIRENPSLSEELLTWAANLEAERQQVQLKIELLGGCADVAVLFKLEGVEVPARVTNSRFSARWEILDWAGRPTGRFLPYRPKQPNTLAKRGYREAILSRPARAMIVAGDPVSQWPHVEVVLDHKIYWRRVDA